MDAILTATGLHTPPQTVSNDELVTAFNAWVELENQRNAAAIASGEVAPRVPSSSEFIVKASGIRSRHVVDREGILDPEVMHPRIPRRSNDEPSILAAMGLDAAREALARAGRESSEVDGIVVACSNLARPYPAIAVEVQHFLGASGFAYDMNVACASAVFGLEAAVNAVRGGSASSVLVISPEICSGHLNFRDRDSHFIFGDAATAMLVESADRAPEAGGYDVLGTRIGTRFSNNIRNNFGFLNRCETPDREPDDLLFVQDGRQVFKEVSPMVAEFLAAHLRDLGIAPDAVRRFWLHQANESMNHLILRRLLGAVPPPDRAPIILDEYANTSSAGCVIALHRHEDGLATGDLGVLSAFGAGYSVGSAVLRRR